MAGIVIKKDPLPSGGNQIVIMNESPGGKIRLFPGTKQVVLVSLNLGGGTYASYRSTNSGDTYESLPTTFPALISDNIAVSFNNRYYYIGDPSTINSDYYVAQSANFGNTFTYDPSASNEVSSLRFYKLAASKDGKYIIACCGAYQSAGEALLSRDFGNTWERPLATNQWYKAFVDPTGQNMLIGGNGYNNALITQYSNDYGATWNNFSESLTTLGNAMISGDGNYKVVWEQYEQSGQFARVYVSTDWSNWTQNNLTKRLIGGSISNDGKYMLLPPSDGFTTGGLEINLSTDYGQNWVSKSMPGVSTEKKWGGSAMSADGKYMIVVSGFNDASPAGAFKSINYGETWEKIIDIPNVNYSSVKMSKSGRYVYIAGSLEGIISSKDYMGSWTQHFDGSTGSGVFINF